MSNIKDGGPAFPSHDKIHGVDFTETGMTLRDYFAAKAMQGLLSCPDFKEMWIDSNEPIKIKYLVNKSYEIADAMLAAREVNHEYR